MRTVWQQSALALAAVAIFGASCAVVQAAAADDPFIKGLQERGLTSLMELYLKQSGAAAGGQTTPGQATPGGTEGGKAMLAALEAQKALAAKNIGERKAQFQKARVLYEEAIAENVKALAAVPADKVTDGYKVRMATIKLRLELANMIFQKWLKQDLDIMELTDRGGGDRPGVTALLKAAGDQYKAISADTTAWLSEVDRLSTTDRSKFVNTGYERQLKAIQRESKFSESWVTYYYGWILPPDFKPAPKERNRNEILNDAITSFQQYTSLPDKVSAKWYAHMVIGLSYRELGKFKEAMQSLAVAENSLAPEDLKIRLVYERAMTLMKQGDYAAARKAIEDGRKQWGDKLKAEIYGLALPIIEAETDITEGKKNNDKGLQDKGMATLRQVHEQGNPWPTIVEWILERLGGGKVEAAVAAGPIDTTNMDPFQIWIKANDLLEAAQKSKDGKAMEQAIALFKAFAEKAGPKDKNYIEALYLQGAGLLQMPARKAEAAAIFRKVADEAPDFKYAAAAAKYSVQARGEVYESAQTDENRAAYEESLKWFVGNKKWFESDPDQQYFYAMILYRGGKHTEAADAFAKVSEKAEHYPDSKYWVPLCHLEQLRNKVLGTKNKTLILSNARVVAQELVAFADYAMQAKDLPEKKREQLADWAETAYINAADVYLYPEVELAADALPILDTMETKFKLDDDARGRLLKLRIDALQKLGKLDEAQKALDAFLKIAKPEDVGPVLRGLFQAMTEDVRELIRRGQKDMATVKVEQAKALGDRLRDWLDKSSLADKAVRIENVRYDLGELLLAVGNYSAAQTLYQEIGGPKPDEMKKDAQGNFAPLKEDCIYGLARAYEGLGDTAPDAAQAKPNFERALELWRVMIKIAESERGTDRNIVWDRRYHGSYCKFRLGFAKEAAAEIKALEIMDPPLGGKDPVTQKKFRDLQAQVNAAAG